GRHPEPLVSAPRRRRELLRRIRIRGVPPAIQMADDAARRAREGHAAEEPAAAVPRAHPGRAAAAEVGQPRKEVRPQRRLAALEAAAFLISWLMAAPPSSNGCAIPRRTPARAPRCCS